MATKEFIMETRIHVGRAEKRMSQQELADKVGVSRQTIASLEKNKYNPSLMLAYSICIALDSKIEELFIFKRKTEVEL